MRPALSTPYLLTLVIPFFNAVATIGDALKSVIKSANAVDSSFHKQPWLQIVGVDNASTDRSADTLWQAWLESGCRHAASLLVVRESLRGVSHARNCGLSHSFGAYIGFVDADDTVTPDYLPELLRAIFHKPDVIHLQFNDVSKNDDIGKATSLLQADQFILHALTGWWCCSFVAKSELFDGLRFSGQCYEDYALFPKLLNRSLTVAVIHRLIYHYHRTAQGLTSQSISWRCQQWNHQYSSLHVSLIRFRPALAKRVRADYLQNRMLLRSLAGLFPALGPLDSLEFILRAGSFDRCLSRLADLFYRNAVAVRNVIKFRFYAAS